MQIIELLQSAFGSDVSDLFIIADKTPYFRKLGKVIPADNTPVTVQAIDDFRRELLLPEAERKFHDEGSFDAGLTIGKEQRFRLNFLMQQGKPGIVARPVPIGSDLSFKKLNLPAPVLELAEKPRGLILVAGSAGSGKSTTLAAMINHINNNFEKHIVTIEDPIEYIHRDNKSLITQREVGADTVSFADGLRNVVRESPDVIVVGEMRDLSTMQTAISAALTGHLVISTIHTADTVQSIERIINYFPEHLRKQAADDLALAIQGVIAQRLLPMADDKGMVPAVEILKTTPMIRNMIAERNFSGLEEAIKRGQEEGMVTFNRAIFSLVKEQKISLETGALAASNSEEFMLLARGMESGIETFRDQFGKEESDSAEMNMKRLLHSAIRNNASDLIVTAGSRPMLRVDGELVPLDTESLTPIDTQRLLFSLLSPRQRGEFESSREIDFALSIMMKLDKEQKDNVQYRFRVNGFYQRGYVGTAIRVIPQRILTPEELKIPPAIVSLTDKKHGLILVTGPTGHGKSTTLASLIDQINAHRGCHIITVEDPIEYVHSNRMAVVEQREVHADTLSFANALKYVLRQDPDVILVGEMRDTETIAAALTAAETGHLVLATLHTNSAPQSIDRIIDSFPAAQQNQIKLQLAGTILGIISQRLIPNKKGDGRVPAFEVMIGTPPVQSLIRDGKTSQLQSVIETSFKDGMITMDKALQELYSKDLISKENYNSLNRNFKTTKGF
ncbi:MAG: PilT/PilU family type 4a pilus ATPase [Victivallaceae bacterium]